MAGYCQCGEEFDQDCDGNDRCPVCDPPCPRCFDGGWPGYDEREDDGDQEEREEEE